MIKKHRILVGFTAATLGATAVIVPVAVTQTQRDATVGPQTTTAPVAANEASSELAPRVSYAAASVNPDPGPPIADEVLTPPTPPVFTDNTTLAYGATALPLPKLPRPAPGYAAWSTSIAYTAEGSNATVTEANLPSLTAGTVVLAASTTSPAEGHKGAPYTGVVRFVIQRLPVVRPEAATMLTSRYAAFTSLSDGILPSRDLSGAVPPSLVANGYLPWDASKVVSKFTDRNGTEFPLSTAADWAYLVRRFQNAQGTALFTISHVWTTTPDPNHYAPVGDAAVTYETRMVAAKTIYIAAETSQGTSAVRHADYYLEGRAASITVMNQFGTIAYGVRRSPSGAAIGDIVPYDLAEASPTAMADGRSYPTVTSGANTDRDLLNYWNRRKNAGAALDTGANDLWKGAQYVSKALVTSNVTLPGTDFNVFSATLADSAVSSTPLVAVEYAAADVEAAVRLVMQLKISYTFVNSLYFVSPEGLTTSATPGEVRDPRDVRQPRPTVNALQRYLTYPFYPVPLTDLSGYWKRDFDLPGAGTTRLGGVRERSLLDFVPASVNSNVANTDIWYRNVDNSGRLPVQLPLEGVAEHAVHASTWYTPYHGNMWESRTRFDFSKFNPYKITDGQFFDVASLSFVPSWDNYSEQATQKVRSSLFDPSVTLLKVGAYVEYKAGRLLLYLVPYISNLPKVSFASSAASAVQVNRDLGFSYQFQDVKVSVDNFNNSTLGW